MRLKLATACSIALAGSSLLAQSASDPVSLKTPETIYNSAPDITPPVLQPAQLLPTSSEKCKRKFQRSESAQFSLVVGSDGKPQWVALVHALGNNLDQAALDLVRGDRFTPATRNGAPVAVWQSIQIELQSCRENPSGKIPNPDAHLIAQPTQTLAALRDAPQTAESPAPTQGETAQPYKIGGGVTPPAPINTPNAVFSNEARKKKIQGVCLISLIVDPHGMPQNPRVVRPVGYGLDQNALEAVRHYRFKPARKGIQPVPVFLSIEVNFRLY